MAEHLHGYPRCETPAGTPCPSSDLNWDECKNHGVLRACEPSVVDGIPTGQYRCSHDDAPAKRAPAKKAAARSKGKPRKAARVKPRAKKKAASPKGRAKKSPRRAKPAARKKTAKRSGGRKSARKKK
jgi:hypothetical protein